MPSKVQRKEALKKLLSQRKLDERRALQAARSPEEAGIDSANRIMEAVAKERAENFEATQ